MNSLAISHSSWRHAFDLVTVFVHKEFTLRYKSTFLGYLWSVLNPLAFALVFFFVFQIIARIESPNHPYLLMLITGLFPWQWFQNSIGVSSMVFIGNAPLIKKVPFNRSLLVLAGVLSDLIHFLVAIPVIFAFMIYYDQWPSWSLLWQVPLLCFVQLVAVQSLSLFAATLNLLFRDMEKLVSIFLMLWFYVTPILYPMESVPEEYRWTLYANPLASLVHCWRSCFLEGTLPLVPFAIISVVSGVSMLLAWTLYKKVEWRFAEHV